MGRPPKPLTEVKLARRLAPIIRRLDAIASRWHDHVPGQLRSELAAIREELAALVPRTEPKLRRRVTKPAP